MQNSGSMLGKLAGVKIAEGVAAIGIHDRLKVDFANAFEVAEVKRVLA